MARSATVLSSSLGPIYVDLRSQNNTIVHTVLYRVLYFTILSFAVLFLTVLFLYCMYSFGNESVILSSERVVMFQPGN